MFGAGVRVWMRRHLRDPDPRTVPLNKKNVYICVLVRAVRKPSHLVSIVPVTKFYRELAELCGYKNIQMYQSIFRLLFGCLNICVSEHRLWLMHNLRNSYRTIGGLCWPPAQKYRWQKRRTKDWRLWRILCMNCVRVHGTFFLRTACNKHYNHQWNTRAVLCVLWVCVFFVCLFLSWCSITSLGPAIVH